MTENHLASDRAAPKQDDEESLHSVAEAVLQLLLEHDFEGVVRALSWRIAVGKRPAYFFRQL